MGNAVTATKDMKIRVTFIKVKKNYFIGFNSHKALFHISRCGVILRDIKVTMVHQHLLSYLPGLYILESGDLRIINLKKREKARGETSRDKRPIQTQKGMSYVKKEQ